MIEIEILNCRSKKKKTLYEQAAKYFVHALLPRAKNLYVDICLESGLDADAFCTQIGNRYFVLEVSKSMPIEEQLKSIAHEMVHCKQFFKKQLQYKDGKIYWLNKYYSNKQLKRKELTKDDYFNYLNTPWEIEAYELENMLYNNFIREYN